MAQDISADLKRGEGYLCGHEIRDTENWEGEALAEPKRQRMANFFGKLLGRQECVPKLLMPLALASG